MLLYLDEFVPLLQAVPESPLAPLSVLPVVLQRSVRLLLLLLLLPQLLPSVSELSRQRGHRPTVTLLLTLLLTLVKKQNERLRFVVAVMWNFRVTNRRQLMAMISF